MIFKVDMETSITNKNVIFTLLATLLPIGTVWLITQIQFWFGAVIAQPIGIFIAIGLGVCLASKVQFSKKCLRIIFWIIYLTLLLQYFGHFLEKGMP